MKAQNKFKSAVSNQRGQGLIEYLIIVALMGAATIGIMRVMSGTVISKFSNVTAALKGESKRFNPPDISTEVTKQKDMKSFMDGANDRGQGKGSKGASPQAQSQADSTY